MKKEMFVQLILDIGLAVEKGTYKPSFLIKEICSIMEYDEVEFLRILINHEDMKL